MALAKQPFGEPNMVIEVYNGLAPWAFYLGLEYDLWDKIKDTLLEIVSV